MLLMLLSVHVTSVLFLVLFNNFALITGFYWSYTLLLKSPILKRSWTVIKYDKYCRPFSLTSK